MKIDVQTFRGEAPRITPRELPGNAAQAAVNARMQTGDLEAWRQMLLTKALSNAGPTQTIYLLKDKWLSWDAQVDVARGLIPGDTTFLTFLTAPAIYTTPRFTTYPLATTGAEPFPVATRPLGVPNPISAPTLAAGVDSTPTTFSVDILDTNDELATKWTVNSPIGGSTAAIVDQQVGYYRVTYDENRSDGTEAWGYRNFGVEGVTVLEAEAEFRFDDVSGEVSRQASMMVGCTAIGGGPGALYDNGTLYVMKHTQWGTFFGGTGLASVAAPGVVEFVFHKMKMKVLDNGDGTKTVTASIEVGGLEIATVTATNTFDDGDYCGFANGASRDGAPYVTAYRNYLVQASGSTGFAPVNTATSYVYTFVNDLGWESGPSAASATILRPDGVSVTVTTPTTAPGGTDPLYAITTKRIYRAVSGATGTTFLLVDEIPLATADYVDTKDDSEVGPDVLESEDWELPNEDMEGIIALPNNTMAGFFRNQLCFSANGHPHAWPIKYRLTTDTDIVAIGNIDNTVVLGTKSFVYTATGNDPSSYSMSKPGEAQSCVSKRSMTYLDGFGVVFASPDGYQVCAGSAGNVKNATEAIFTKRQWEALTPSSIIAAVHDGVLHFWFTGSTPDAGYALDTKQSGFGLISLSYHACAAHVDPITDALYLVLDVNSEPTNGSLPLASTAVAASGVTIYQFDASATNKMVYRWRGKLNLLPHPSVFHFAKVEANDFANMVLRFYANGALLHQAVVSSAAEFRLPGAVAAYNSIEVEILGTSSVRVTQIVQDIMEFD